MLTALRRFATAVSLLLGVLVIVAWAWSRYEADAGVWRVLRPGKGGSGSVGFYAVEMKDGRAGFQSEFQHFASPKSFDCEARETRPPHVFGSREGLGEGILVIDRASTWGFLVDFSIVSGSRPGETGEVRSVILPLWLLALLLAVIPGARGYVAFKRRHARGRGLCVECGYDLRATPERCPECGADTSAPSRAWAARTAGLAGAMLFLIVVGRSVVVFIRSSTHAAEASWERFETDQALLKAVAAEDVRAATKALDQGADPNVRGEASDYETAVWLAVRNRSAPMVHLLSGRGADLKERNKSQQTLMSVSLSNRATDVVQQLLLGGADVNTNDENGPPLSEIISQDNYTVMGLLLKNRASVNPHDTNGDTPLHEAVRRGKFRAVAMLLEHGADPRRRNTHGRVPLHMISKSENASEIATILLEHGGEPNAMDDLGWTPLHYAMSCDSRGLVAQLLKRGADPRARDIYGRTPLHMLAGEASDSDIADILLKSGAELNAADNEGHTPLHEAVVLRDMNLARRLLLRGADPSIQDADGQTARDLAKTAKDVMMVKVLDDAQSSR
jgi:ankyrin repeat protein